TDELALDEQLGERRPLRVLLHPGADLGIREDVHRRILRNQRVQDVHDRRREPALGEAAAALHEQADGVTRDELVALLAGRSVERHGGLSWLRLARRSWSERSVRSPTSTPPRGTASSTARHRSSATGSCAPSRTPGRSSPRPRGARAPAGPACTSWPNRQA